MTKNKYIFFIDNRRSSDVVDSVSSPSAKRRRSSQSLSNQLDDSISRMYLSQPVPFVQHSIVANVEEAIEARQHISFSQPTMMDDLILCTQLNSTQGATQNVFQKLVKRMTRFFVSTKCDDTLKRLSSALDKLGYIWKASDEAVVTISTIDRRKLRLVFKATLIEMDGKMLLDFRLSKGCGLEFKRRFIKIKQNMSDIIMKGPVMWPVAIATNSVP